MRRPGALSGFTILCALRQGPYGVESINRVVERILKEQGLINPAQQMVSGPANHG